MLRNVKVFLGTKMVLEIIDRLTEQNVLSGFRRKEVKQHGKNKSII